MYTLYIYIYICDIIISIQAVSCGRKTWRTSKKVTPRIPLQIREAVDHLSTPLFQTINHMVSNHLGDRGALEVGCFLDIYRYLRLIYC